MPIDILPWILELFNQYGLYAMFLLLMIDGAMLNPILPGEAVMILAVRQHAHTTTDLAFLIGLATLAGILGTIILYTLARIGGRHLIDKHPRFFMMDQKKRQDLEKTFEGSFGQSLVLFLRVIPMTRVVVNIPAGIAKMKFGRFLALSSIGLFIFHAGFMWLAFEMQTPDSPVALQASHLQEAYANPAWEFLKTNEALVVATGLLIGSYLSFKSSRRMLKYPLKTMSSLLGWITVRTLLIASITIAALLFYDPSIAFALATAGGMDIHVIANTLTMDPIRVAAYIATIAWTLGILLWGFEAGAKRRQRKAKHLEEVQLEPLEDEITTEEPA